MSMSDECGAPTIERHSGSDFLALLESCSGSDPDYLSFWRDILSVFNTSDWNEVNKNFRIVTGQWLDSPYGKATKFMLDQQGVTVHHNGNLAEVRWLTNVGRDALSELASRYSWAGVYRPG